MVRKTLNGPAPSKKKFVVIIVIIVILILGGIGLLIWKLQNKTDDNSDNQANGYSGVTAECGDVFQCIDKLDPNSSLEEMNNIIGQKAELATEKDNQKIYKWALADDTTIEARFTTYDNSDGPKTFVTFNINYPENLVAHDADLSHWEEIKSRMNSEEGITYDQIVELVGGTSGTMVEKSQDSKKYQWFDNAGHYLNASIDNETGKCTFATGRL